MVGRGGRGEPGWVPTEGPGPPCPGRGEDGALRREAGPNLRGHGPARLSRGPQHPDLGLAPRTSPLVCFSDSRGPAGQLLGRRGREDPHPGQLLGRRGAVKTPIRAEGGDSVRLAEKCQSQLPGPCHGGGAPEERPLVQDEGWARAPCPHGRPRCWASRAQARAPPEVGRGDRDKMSPSHSERRGPPSQTAPAPRCRPD